MTIITAEEYKRENIERLTNSPRHMEIALARRILDECGVCKHQEKSFTCGASLCVIGRNYPCIACAFLKWVGTDREKDLTCGGQGWLKACEDFDKSERSNTPVAQR